jgi:hypothetical protein
MDPRELEALGLYDPAAPDADERRALLAMALPAERSWLEKATCLARS